jgi:CheY-like chemotaxis protein
VDRNLTILIADDDADYAFLLQRAFRAIGLKNPVQVLANGEEALAYLKGEGKYADRAEFPVPSVVFTDLNMPLASGFDVFQWMQGHPECRVVPRIVISSSDEDQDVARAYELGAHAYMEKPFLQRDLEASLRTTREFWARCLKPPLQHAAA